jgi:hypothetical protein
VMPTKSYFSQSELPITIGLGKTGKIDSLEIKWTDGSVQPVPAIVLKKLIVVEQAQSMAFGQ